MLKSLVLSSLSSISIITGVGNAFANSSLRHKYQNLVSNSFLKNEKQSSQTNDTSPSHSTWVLILNSGSFSYLSKLVNQLVIEPSKPPVQVSTSEIFSSSSELYPGKLQQLINSFLSDLSWTHLIEVLEDRKPATNSDSNNSNNLQTLFPEFKSRLLSFNSCLELSIFTLIVWLLSCTSLVGSSIYFCSKFNNLKKKDKLKWLIYHLITQLPGWLLKYRRQLSKLRESKPISKNIPLFSKSGDAFSLSNLNYSINGVEILKNINLKLQKNEFYAIIGPNGAGKTTLLKHLGRLLTPNGGQISLGLKKLDSIKDRDFWAKVAYIPQEISIPPDTPVYDFLLSSRFISMGRSQRVSKQDHLKVLQAIKSCQLQNLRWSKMGDLSGGQRQKVILATILVKDAELILLDEPTTFLDIDNRNFLTSFFKELHASGKTIIANLHKFSEINKLATTVIAMKDGKLQKVGDKEELLTTPFLNSLYDLTLSDEKWNSLIYPSKLNY